MKRLRVPLSYPAPDGFDGVSQATCRGGSFRVEWVAGFVWNQWQPWSGIRKVLYRSRMLSNSAFRNFAMVLFLIARFLDGHLWQACGTAGNADRSQTHPLHRSLS